MSKKCGFNWIPAVDSCSFAFTSKAQLNLKPKHLAIFCCVCFHFFSNLWTPKDIPCGREQEKTDICFCRRNLGRKWKEVFWIFIFEWTVELWKGDPLHTEGSITTFWWCGYLTVQYLLIRWGSRWLGARQFFGKKMNVYYNNENNRRFIVLRWMICVKKMKTEEKKCCCVHHSTRRCNREQGRSRLTLFVGSLCLFECCFSYVVWEWKSQGENMLVYSKAGIEDSMIYIIVFGEWKRGFGKSWKNE